MKTRVIAAAAVAAAATVVLTSLPASAFSPRQPSVAKAVTVKMTTHHIRQTRTSGAQTVVTLDNGRQIAMSTADYQRAHATFASQDRGNATPGATMAPRNTVPGDCGTATVTLANTSTHLQYRMSTGFTVSPPAVAYGWSVYINGAGSHYYEYHYHASGDLAFRSSWSGGHTGTVPAIDYYEADIDIGGSWALTSNDTLCSAAPVSEYTQIYH